MSEKKYVIVRPGNQSGSSVFAGVLEGYTDTTVTLTDARRIWRWEGAASLSGLAVYGTTNPDGCKFPAPVEKVVVSGWSEIIYCSLEGAKSIREVPEWKS